MKTKKLNQMAVALVLLAVLILPCSKSWAQGTAFTYQGRLNSSGAPANGPYDFRFRLAADPLANTYVGNPYLTNSIPVTNGLFTTTMDFGPGIFAGSNYWLEVDVRTNGGSSYTMLSPLQALTPTPYAIFANTASNLSGTLLAGQLSGMVGNGNLPSSPTVSGTVTAGSFTGNGANVTNVNAAALNGLNASNFWQTVGNNGTTAGVNYLGTRDNQPVELHVNGTRALRLEPTPTNNALNVIGGSPVNWVSNSVVGATIAGGGWTTFIYALPSYGNVGSNSVAANFGTVGGGVGNTAGGAYSTVAGGFGGYAAGLGSFVGGGGIDNFDYPGGNFATGAGSAVVAGVHNTASFFDGFVGAGRFNISAAEDAVVVGGENNSIQSGAGESFIGGGYNSVIQSTSLYGTIGGGFDNTISGNGDVIGGGGISPNTSFYPNGNSAAGNDSVVGGGVSNHATDDFAVVSGGVHNTSGNFASTVSGGWNDVASGQFATVGGGTQNDATNNYATIPGGADNLAGGQYSFAGGYQAQAVHDGAFVWADSQGTPFASTGNNQFLIRAGGGVGIGTTTPFAALDVASASGAPQFEVDQLNPDYARIRLNALTNSYWDIAAQSELNFYNSSYGNIMTIAKNGTVGVGVAVPAHTLDVGGRIRLRQEGFGNSAGLWLYQNDYANDRAFIGLDNDAYLGLWGNLGANWGLVMNVTNGFIGIGNLAPSTYLQVVNATCNGSSWVNASDRNLKQDFAPVSVEDVLSKVVSLPVQSWDYKAQPGEKHIGPVAQDFHAAFGLNGADDRHIATVDESGVALAAIQGLNQKLEEQKAENAELKQRLAKLESLVEQMAQERK